jgi:Ca2+-binding EF-hand superfamily protein
MRLPITTIAIACFAVISQSRAEQNPRTQEDVERVFESIDRNDDDRISKREGQRAEVIRGRFKGVDADQDGYLSRAEYRARPRKERFE